MYVGGVNFTSLLFMNIYRIYIFIACFSFAPLLMNWQKGGEEFGEFYMHVYFISLFMQKGEEELLCMFISLFLHICVVLFMHFIEYLYVYCYAWVKGELLLKFNPCIYNSMSFVIIKKGEIVGSKAHHSSFDDELM